MEQGIFLLTICAYALAGYLSWRERTASYVVGLLAGHLTVVLSPIWQLLYGFEYADLSPAFQLAGRPLPRAVLMGGWAVTLPPLVILFLLRRRWWVASYATAVLTLTLFILYHLLIETVGLRANWWVYTSAPMLPLGLPITLVSAVMNGLVSFGMLAAVLLTRHYSWSSLLLFVLPVAPLLAIFVHGLLGAPLFTARLLGTQSWAGVIGMVGTLGLLIWSAHIMASALAQRRGFGSGV